MTDSPNAFKDVVAGDKPENPTLARQRKEHQLATDKRHDNLMHWFWVAVLLGIGIGSSSLFGLVVYFTAIEKQIIAEQFRMYLVFLISHTVFAAVGAFFARARAT